MGLAARPGRGVPAVHHAHETPADRRIPGWRTGPEPVGSAVPAVHVSAARGALLRVVRRDPQGLQHRGRGPWLPVDVPGTGGRGDGPSARGRRGGARPRRRQQGRGGVRTVGPVRAAAAPHGRLGSLPCRRAPEGAGAHRADRTRRQPAGAWVSSTSHATTAPGRPRAVGVRSSSTVIATLSTATASSSPRRPSSPCSRRARLRGWLARTVVPSAPGAGWTSPAPNAGSAGGADAAHGRTWNCGPASIPRP